MKTINTYISTIERISSIDDYISTFKRISSIDDYIIEKLHINKATKLEYMYHPKTKDELIECIKYKIDNEGLGTKDMPLDLNDIDTSKIEDMSGLFSYFGSLKELSKNGYFDISGWDVSKVINMGSMFQGSNFNGDLSKWDVSNVKIMSGMFFNSNFTGENGDISNWDVSNVKNTRHMFYSCPLRTSPPRWYV